MKTLSPKLNERREVVMRQSANNSHEKKNKSLPRRTEAPRCRRGVGGGEYWFKSSMVQRKTIILFIPDEGEK